MIAGRSSRLALLGVALFFTVFMGMAHVHLNGGVDDLAQSVPSSQKPATGVPPPGAHRVAVADDTGDFDEPPTKAAIPPAKSSPKSSSTDEKKKPSGSSAPSKTPSKGEHGSMDDLERIEDDKQPDMPAGTKDSSNKDGYKDGSKTDTDDAKDATSSYPLADVSAFRPEQWVFPAVKPDSPEYAAYGHWPDKLADAKNAPWKERLGKKLCIVDLESRDFTKDGELWGESMSWNKSSKVHGPSGGTLNHWVYAKIHGYQYYYVKINTYKDRRDSWKKPSVLSKILKKHDACVFIDSDAMFNNLDLPMEWLMNYWDISPKNNSLALASDPDTPHNRNRFGHLFLNTGFMIMQNNANLYKMFVDWDQCADEGGKYPGCTEFRNRKGWQPTDQGGFGTFIRYDYAKDIRELPCAEANGFVESNTGCNGKYIKHVWLGKEDRLVLAIGAIFPGVLLETFHRQFKAEKSTFYTTEDKIMSGGSWF